MKQLPSLAIFPSALALASPLALGQASFDLLGPFVGGSTSYIARDVSADGRIIVGHVPLVGPFTWNAASGFTFLPLPQSSDFPASQPGETLHVVPIEISPDARSIVGGVVFASERHQGFRWTASTGYTALPGVAGTQSFDQSYATTTNAAGTLAAGWMRAPIYRKPILWDLTQPNAPIAVPLLPGDVVGEIEELADEAVVAVGTSYADYGSTVPHAIRWTPAGGTMELPAPPGMVDARAGCVTADGLVTFGGAETVAGGTTRMVRWDALGRSEVIGDIPAHHNYLRVVACNGDGSAAVGTTRSWIYDETSFYWSESTGFVDLRSFLESRGATITGSPVQRMIVRGMSFDGNVIMGVMQSYGGNAVTIGFTARLSPEDPHPVGVDFCTPAVVNSIGASPKLEAIGSAALANNDLVLNVRGLPGRSFGSVLVSQTQDSLPGFGGGVGTQCLGTSFAFLTPSGSAPLGGIFQRVAFRLDLPTLPLSSGATMIHPGDTWNFQFWYRDRGATGSTTYLSSALSITFQ